MKEKLIIRNFGPIKSVELDLGRFNVLIGEQATGKSTVAKVLAVCRYFSYIIGNDIIGDDFFEEGLISWGLGDAIHDDTYIFYDCQHYSLTIERQLRSVYSYEKDDGDIVSEPIFTFSSSLVPKSKEFKHLIGELEKIKPSPGEFPGWAIPSSFFRNDVAGVMDNPFYLHEERGLQSVFSLGKSSIQNISDSLFNQFARTDQILRQFGLETEIEPLDIVYKNEQGNGFVRKKKEKGFFNLNNAASGFQATIPIVLSIRYYSEMRKKKKTFIIEEPELGIFPAAQQRLIQFLVDKTMNYGNTMLVTTHSPYTLTSLNNMMYAYQMGENHSVEADNIIKKKYWIGPDNVSAYMLLPDGTCKDIFDREEGLIKAEKIDDISGVLNEQFNALLNIEFGKK